MWEGGGLLQLAREHLGPGRLAQLAQRLGLDLSNPLRADVEVFPDLLSGHRLVFVQAEAHAQHLFLSRGEGAQRVVQLTSQVVCCHDILEVLWLGQHERSSQPEGQVLGRNLECDLDLLEAVELDWEELFAAKAEVRGEALGNLPVPLLVCAKRGLREVEQACDRSLGETVFPAEGRDRRPHVVDSMPEDVVPEARFDSQGVFSCLGHLILFHPCWVAVSRDARPTRLCWSKTMDVPDEYGV